MSARILLQGDREIACVIIDHAAKANALTAALLDEFCSILGRLATEPPRVLVVTGAGDRSFIGGAFIDEMAGMNATSARAFITRVHRACDALRQFPAPVVARIQGITFGAGLEMAACCDIRVAAEEAVLGMPEVKLGIPSVVEAAVLPRLIGEGRARWLLLTGESISAKKALEWGLVEEVVPRAGLDAAVDRLVKVLLANGPEALRAQKRLMNRWQEVPLAEGVAAGIDAFAASYAGVEPREKMEAFLAGKRKS